jgi:hypothetical protein
MFMSYLLTYAKEVWYLCMKTHLEVPRALQSPRIKRIAELVNTITEKYKDFVRLEVLIAVTIKITTF